jgi:CarD family transcriptional regulator
VTFHAQAVAAKTRQKSTSSKAAKKAAAVKAVAKKAAAQKAAAQKAASKKAASKKAAAGKSRQVGKLSQAAVRRTAAKPKTKASGALKPRGKGEKSRMIANNNKTAAPKAAAPSKKTNAAERTSKKAIEQARKPLHAEKKPVEQVKKVVEAKSVEAKSVEAKFVEAKPVEAKVAETRAVETAKRPVEAARKPVETAPVAKKAPEPVVAKKSTNQRHGFKTQEFIVYPAHGVGQIVSIEEQEVAGYKLELFVISFAKDKMTLRVPITKVASVGMRKLAEGAVVRRALETLKGRARIKRTMWSRRAQEYEAKINSGDIIAIAEVVRDLFRSDTQPEQSYSERQLYEAALDRLAREIGAVERVTDTEAVKQIEGALAKGPRRGPKPADGAAEGDEEALVEEAA